MNSHRPNSFIISASDHGTMIVNRNDYREQENGVIGVGAQILNTQSFDKREVELVLRILRKRREIYGSGVIALDCGANIGVHTIEWAKTMYGWGNVHAFEAQERLFYALAGNIAVNNCANARATWAAVGKLDGTIGVPILNYDRPASFGSLELRASKSNEDIGQPVDYASSKTQKTPLVSLDSQSFKRVDFIKIDVEGMELEVLTGAKKILRKSRPVMLIEQIKADTNQLEQFLTNAGYHYYPVGLNLLAVHQTDQMEIISKNSAPNNGKSRSSGA